jgi:glycosyltransferase involved in cell wall biosynthesis
VDRPQLRTEHHFVHYFDPSCRLFTRWAAERTDAIVAVSDFVRHTIVLAMPILGFRTTVARNGVDTAYWSPRDKAALGFRAGIVCRLTAWKRVHLAIRASAIAGVDLVVVGSGEERGRLESLAQSLDAPVRFVGYEPDPRPLIAECDVMLNTSDREPLGLSVMEALAMGRPVIACSGGGIPEILKDGDTGLLVREASAEAFAHALRSVRDDPGRRATMGMRAREYAVAEGSIERTCEVYAREYDRLSRDPRSGALR